MKLQRAFNTSNSNQTRSKLGTSSLRTRYELAVLTSMEHICKCIGHALSMLAFLAPTSFFPAKATVCPRRRELAPNLHRTRSELATSSLRTRDELAPNSQQPASYCTIFFMSHRCSFHLLCVLLDVLIRFFMCFHVFICCSRLSICFCAVKDCRAFCYAPFRFFMLFQVVSDYVCICVNDLRLFNAFHALR